ncbi:MAG: hypothetical protein ACXAC5_04115 [Promethearchaeota archaeon]|jgi:hypothetical protein
MLDNLKSHAINIISLIAAWAVILLVVFIFSVMGYGIIILLQALNSEGLTYFWVILSIVLIPPITLWAVWLRKHP